MAYVRQGKAKIRPLYSSGIPFSSFKTSVKNEEEYVINKQITEQEIKAKAHLLLKMNIEKVTFFAGLSLLPSSSSPYSNDLFRAFGAAKNVKIALKVKTAAKKKKVQK